ncbi:MAG: hypothetical protein Q7R87_04585 [Nanoarchaeota archaeon]|nr:hypothetical protein [Nanoarchaeota archaeon]
MQANIRNNGYSLFLKPDEVNRIGKDSSLQARLYDETSNRLDTGKSLHLGLGGNKEGIDARLKYSQRERNKLYITVTKAGKRKLLAGEPVLAKYALGTITVQVELRS